MPIIPRRVAMAVNIPGHDAVRHEKEWETQGHWIERNGERIWIPDHEDYAHKEDEIRYKMTPLSRDQKRLGIVLNYVTNSKKGLSGRIFQDTKGNIEYGVINNSKDPSSTGGYLAYIGEASNLEDAKRALNRKLQEYWGLSNPRYRVRVHTVRRKEIGFGGQFNNVATKVAEEYRGKGYSKEEAEKIGKETAAGIYREKLAKAHQGRS